MNVFHTPVNYGSLPSHSVRCLRAAGINANGLVFSNSVVQSSDGLRIVSVDARPPSLRWALGMAQWATIFTKTILASNPDVIHWYFGKKALPFSLDLHFIRNIPRLVEWQGSDIRNPEIESADNPYYQYAFANGYESNDNAENSYRLQKRFADAGFACAAPLGMLPYVQKELFPEIHIVRPRIVLDDFTAVYPDPQNTRPLIIHSPTAPVIKGTKVVLEAIEKLKSSYTFDFKLIHHMPRHQAMEWFQQADIIVDQLVLGDHGVVALEAMATGKPVVCYLKPSMVRGYPDDLPIVNSTQENLVEVLGYLLNHPAERFEIGKRGREYMEKHHQPAQIAAELIAIYEKVIAGFRK